MTEHGVVPGPWPNPREELLLAAALRRGAPALAAWEAWVAGLDPGRLEEQVEPDSQWLMPLLYWNLRRDVEHPVLARCRNVYLHNWYKNNAMLHALASALRPDAPAGPRPILLKGAAMAVRYYETPGVRPFVTLDAWVPSARPDAARWPAPLAESLTLHDAPLGPARAAELLGRLQPATFMGVTASVMSPPDQLVHICLERRTWDPRTRLVWLADAAQVLRRSPELDWETALAVASDLGGDRVLVAVRDYLDRFDVLPGTPAPDGRAPRRAADTLGR